MPVDQVQYSRLDVVVPGLVEHAWVTRHDTPSVEILLPDGRGLVQLVAGEPAQLVDVSTGVTRAEASGVRGLLTRPVVRIARAPGVRLGLQLHPSALATVGAPPLVDSWALPEHVLDEVVVAAASGALADGHDEEAARLLADGLAARRRDDEPDAVRFRELLRYIDDNHGALTAQELARFAEVTVSDVFRWTGRFLGMPPADYAAAVRFAVFVRRAVGPGIVRPQAVLQALRWYADAGYPPREVERTTGMSPVELRRVEERIASLVAGPNV